MIIGVCGFGSTGSSAVSDYLSEFDCTQVIDRIEFTWVTQFDGLIDLEHHLFHSKNRTGDSIAAIYRYKTACLSSCNYYTRSGKIDKNLYLKSTDDFLNSITQIKWPWFMYRNFGFFERLRGKIFRVFTSKKEEKERIQYTKYPLRFVSFSMCPENFYDAAKQHVRELLAGFGADFTKDIVLDQPFAGNNPVAAFPFYDNPYAIVVDRDPRDLYCFAKTKLAGRNHFMPVNNVEDFIKYYRLLRDKQPYLEDNERILRIRFEDLVYNYDKTTERIRSFLGYARNPRPKSVFDPKLSIANTQVYKRFPEYANDVKTIEKELKEYLFDYDKYKEPENKDMFFGKSALNKNK